MLFRTVLISAAAIAVSVGPSTAKFLGLEPGFPVNRVDPENPPPPPRPRETPNWYVIRDNQTNECFVRYARPGNMGGSAVAKQWTEDDAYDARDRMRRNGTCRG